jgi:tRNA nucleotidyltransferase (CCA-adding enzyme)
VQTLCSPKNPIESRAFPDPVIEVVTRIQRTGHQAYVVGGSLRDILLGIEPKDFDVSTSALPQEISNIFDNVIPTGEQYGTMTVVQDDLPVEITTFRADGRYSGHRPQNVRFGVSLLDDLARRDYSVNSCAYDPLSGELVDPYDVVGQLTAGDVTICAVGNPIERFTEDPLRMLRSVYLMKRLDDAGRNCIIDYDTYNAIRSNARRIVSMSTERVRNELNKIIVGKNPGRYFAMLMQTGLLQYTIPEIADTYGIEQNEYHIKDIFGHTMLVMDNIPPDLHLRWAALLHDVGKPTTISNVGGHIHFYGHQIVGARIAESVLRRFNFPVDCIKKVEFLIQVHMSPTPENEKAARHLIAKMGDSLNDFLALRKADVLGGKRRILDRYDMLVAAVDKEMSRKPAFSVKDIAINGHDVMNTLCIGPGPQVGMILNAVFEAVLDDPDLNNRDDLIRIVGYR